MSRRPNLNGCVHVESNVTIRVQGAHRANECILHSFGWITSQHIFPQPKYATSNQHTYPRTQLVVLEYPRCGHRYAFLSSKSLWQHSKYCLIPNQQQGEVRYTYLVIYKQIVSFERAGTWVYAMPLFWTKPACGIFSATDNENTIIILRSPHTCTTHYIVTPSGGSGRA